MANITEAMNACARVAAQVVHTASTMANAGQIHAKMVAVVRMHLKITHATVRMDGQV